MLVGQHCGFTATPSFTGGLDFAQGGARVNSPSAVGTARRARTCRSHSRSTCSSRGRPSRSQRALPDPGRRATTSSRSRRNSWAGRSRRRRCRPASRRPRSTSPRRSCGCARPARSTSCCSSFRTWARRPTPSRPERRRRQLFTALSQTVFNSTLNSAIGASGRAGHPVQHVGAAERDHRQPVAVRVRQRHQARAARRASSLQCTPSTLVAPNANMNYVFADGVHPTTGADIVLSQAIVSMITGPQQMAALGQAPIDVERANWRTLDSRMMSADQRARARGQAPGVGGVRLRERRHLRARASSGNGDINTSRSAATCASPTACSPACSSRTREYKGDFGNGGGDFKLREPMMTAYGGYGEGPWYVGATLGLGSLDYSTNRTIALGADDAHRSPATPTATTTSRACSAATGSSTGTGTTGRSPSSRGEKDRRAPVQRERQRQHRAHLQPAEGRRVRGRAWASRPPATSSGFRPFARATWEYNFDADTRSGQGQVEHARTELVHRARLRRRTTTGGCSTLGVSRDFGRVTGFLSGQRLRRQRRRRLLGDHGGNSRPACKRAESREGARGPAIARTPYHDVHSPSTSAHGLRQRRARARARRARETRRARSKAGCARASRHAASSSSSAG